ncbi:MAG: biotin/lipoyl-binding protein, partial [Candidatus Pacebacteria bacterium]|nr:biotin/lipoyl-binding protein [Candidatus Paceibacterota bacterium]
MKFIYIRKHPILSVAVAIVFGIIALSVVFSEEEGETYETMIVAYDNLVQTVEVTGKVQPTEERELAFERSGIVSSVLVSVGDRVVQGQKLVYLGAAELYAQLKQAEASVVQAQNTLSELQRGSRPEELVLSRTAVENARSVFEDAETSYEIVLEKADTDLLSAYNGAVTTARSGAVSAKNALISLSEIQYIRFIQAGVNDDDLSNKKAIAVEALFDLSNAGSWTAESISDLLSGVYGEIQTTAIISNPNIIYEKLEEMLNALNMTSDALGSMPILTTFSATEKADLSAQKTAISAAIVSLSAKLQLIDVQKIANTSAINTAKATANTAENNLLQAQNELILKEAGSTAEAISVGGSQVNSAVAQKELIEAQIRTTILTTPI